MKYAFSEVVTAGSSSPEHISPVGDEGLKLGGGAPEPLCGMPWPNGWHLPRFVNEALIDARTCKRCADAWRAVRGVSGSKPNPEAK